MAARWLPPPPSSSPRSRHPRSRRHPPQRPSEITLHSPTRRDKKVVHGGYPSRRLPNPLARLLLPNPLASLFLPNRRHPRSSTAYLPQSPPPILPNRPASISPPIPFYYTLAPSPPPVFFMAGVGRGKGSMAPRMRIPPACLFPRAQQEEHEPPLTEFSKGNTSAGEQHQGALPDSIHGGEPPIRYYLLFKPFRFFISLDFPLFYFSIYLTGRSCSQ
jgi:hypothetical protein